MQVDAVEANVEFTLTESQSQSQSEQVAQVTQPVYNKPIGSERPKIQSVGTKLANSASPVLNEENSNASNSTSSASSSPVQAQQSLSVNTEMNLQSPNSSLQLSNLVMQQRQSSSAKNTESSGSMAVAAAQLAAISNLVPDLEKEKLRLDLMRQTELSSKLETLCLQYRQVRVFFLEFWSCVDF